jgi:hypothetical protein
VDKGRTTITNKKKFESIIKSLPTKKSPGPNDFPGEYNQVTVILLNLFENN